MHRLARWTLLAALVLGANAWAGPMSLWVGQKQTLFIFQKIAKVEISNPGVLRVSRVPSVGLDMRSVAPGITDVKIHCTDGSLYEFRVHSTNGAEIYSLNRNEPEHSQWTLSSSQPVRDAKPQRTAAAKAKKSSKRPA